MKRKPTLEELLESWSVLHPGQWENENAVTLGSWFAVAKQFINYTTPRQKKFSALF